MKTEITGIAHYLPPYVVDNLEISERYPKGGSPEDIFGKTGIKKRRYSKDLTTGQMAIESVKALFEKTQTKASEIDVVIVGTLSPDYYYPATAAVLINKIEAVNAYGFDVINACPSFLNALMLADVMIRSGESKKIVVCGADRMSTTLNAFDYKTGLLFGDGAASVLLEPSLNRLSGINDCAVKVVPGFTEDVYYRTPFSSKDYSNEKFELDGQKVYKHGVSLTVDFVREFLEKHSLTLKDFKYVIPHQANMRMIREIAEKLQAPIEKFLVNIEHVGNTAGASVPLCLSEKVDEGIVQKGDRLLLVSFGAGYVLSLSDLYF